MLLTIADEYIRDGWYTLPQRLDPAILANIRASIERISGMKREEVVCEEDGHTVRALHGCHRFDPVCAELVGLPLLLDLAEAIIGDKVYVYQFKVNIKGARNGEKWPWHQDFAFWKYEDGMPTDRAVNIAINLDEVHESNGPLQVLTGTHKLGLVDPGSSDGHGGDWREHVSANLTYTVSDDSVARLKESHPVQHLVGPPGTISAFHPSIVHASSPNRSSDRRTVLFITYNALDNAPKNPQRPNFLVDRSVTPVKRLVTPLALTGAVDRSASDLGRGHGEE